MNSYRGLLLELSNSLTSSDLEGLKFLCRDVIPAGRAERITRPFEFFSALEQLNMLSEENRDFLASKLIAINRNDLRNKLLGIQGDQNGQAGIPREEAPSGLYSGTVPNELIHDLVEDLSTSWKMLGRRLGLPEGVLRNIDTENRRVVERGVAMFEEWTNRKTNAATMQVLRDALEKIGRRDLSEKVRDFALSQQEEQLRAAVEHEQQQIEAALERRPFPNLQDLGSALPNNQPFIPGVQRQPEEQGDSPQRPSASSGLRDQPLPRPPATSGHWVSPLSMPAASRPDFPLRQPVPGHSDAPAAVPSASPSGASVGLIGPASPPIPQRAPVPVHVADQGPVRQRPPASTLADPSLPYPTPVSQTTQDDPSALQRQAPAPPSSGPSPLRQDSSSTDAVHVEVNPGQVHVHSRGVSGQDITDHGRDDNVRTSVPVESAPRLTTEGSYLDPEKYEPVKLLGSGGFAKVYLCKSRGTGRRMAVKMFDLGVNHHETQKQADAVSKEVRILSAVKHKHIVEFFHVEKSHNTLSLFLEYMEGGSVEELLRHKGPMEEPLVRKFTRQILIAVDFLHNQGIIHKDIKGGNVLLDKQQMNIKLADFGISKVMDKLITATGGLMTKNTVASFHWTSPELLSNKPFKRNTDIWSVGCTVVEMLTTKPPLMEEDLDVCQKLLQIVTLQIQPPQDCTSVAYGFLTKCLCANDVRPSAAQLLEEDPFVNFTEQERNQLAWLFA